VGEGRNRGAPVTAWFDDLAHVPRGGLESSKPANPDALVTGAPGRVYPSSPIVSHRTHDAKGGPFTARVAAPPKRGDRDRRQEAKNFGLPAPARFRGPRVIRRRGGTQLAGNHRRGQRSRAGGSTTPRNRPPPAIVPTPFAGGPFTVAPSRAPARRPTHPAPRAVVSVADFNY